ncbi:MAG: hypothetical protein EKK57_10750 [Proteobacteria bacterium]|nr:MAG: hypothetical protein EKK57_10750 [Pseudomonadota bacterium]
MKKLKFILLGLAGLSLFACNSGGGTTPSNDVQNISGASPSGSSSTYNIVGLATNCRVTPSNCQVSLTISTTGTYANNNIVGYQIGAQSPQSTTCVTSLQTKTCDFTIYGNVTTGTSTFITLGGAPTSANFIIGGGL